MLNEEFVRWGEPFGLALSYRWDCSEILNLFGRRVQKQMFCLGTSLRGQAKLPGVGLPSQQHLAHVIDDILGSRGLSIVNQKMAPKTREVCYSG